MINFFKKKKNGLILRFRRLKLKLKGNSRPSSYPVITGDSFRALANHIHDETGTFLFGGVAKGDIVFVSQSKSLSYLKEIHPNIIVPYILIVHNGDETFDSRYASLLDDNIIHCSRNHKLFNLKNLLITEETSKAVACDIFEKSEELNKTVTRFPSTSKILY
mgnify:CR=1 FL=1